MNKRDPYEEGKEFAKNSIEKYKYLLKTPNNNQIPPNFREIKTCADCEHFDHEHTIKSLCKKYNFDLTTIKQKSVYEKLKLLPPPISFNMEFYLCDGIKERNQNDKK